MSLGLFWSLFEYFWFCPIKNISPCTCLVSFVSAQHHQSPLAIIFSLRHTLLAYWIHKHINHLIKTLHHHISIFFLWTLEFKTSKFDRRDSRCSSFYAAMSGSSHMIWPHCVCLNLTKEKHLFPALLVFLFPKPPHKMGHVLIIVDNETWDYSPSPSLLSCRLLVGSCYHHGTDWNMTVNCFMQIWNQMFGLPVCKWFLCLGIQKLQARCLLLVQKGSHLTEQTLHFQGFFFVLILHRKSKTH